MPAENIETDWRRVLNRIRNLWKPAPRQQSVPADGQPQPVSRAVGPIGTRRSFAD